MTQPLPRLATGQRATLWQPMDPQPPEDCGNFRVGRYFPVMKDDNGMLFDGPEIFGASNEDWGCEAPHSPGDIIDGSRVVSVDVQQREGVWSWVVEREMQS